MNFVTYKFIYFFLSIIAIIVLVHCCTELYNNYEGFLLENKYIIDHIE